MASIIDRVEARARQMRAAFPTQDVDRYTTPSMLGGSETFSPESYGNYLATSNEFYSAADLRARLMSSAQVRLRFYQGVEPDLKEVGKTRATDLLRHVNPHWSYRRLIRASELSMCTWGENFWVLERPRRGAMPREIWWVKPSRMIPVPHPTEYLSGYLYKPANGGQPIPFRPDEVIWFRYPNPIDEFAPLAPLAAARLAADVASAGAQANRNLFAQGLTLGGIVVPQTDKVQFSQEQSEELQTLLERRFSGVDKAHKWAVLRYEAQFKGLDVTPKDAEFIQAMNLSARQVWRALGVPPPLLGDLEFATLANARVYQTILWEHALVPEGDFFAGELEEQYLPHFPNTADLIQFDASRVPALQDAVTAAWTRDGQQIDRGALLINEWRKKNGMPPVPWGDAYWAPLNKVPITSADQSTVQTAPGADGGQATLAHLSMLADALADLMPAPASNGHHEPVPA